MKNIYIIYTLLLIGVTVISTSCESLLEEEVKDQISSDYVFTTEEGLEAGVTAIYNLQRQNNFPTGIGNTGFDINSFFYIATDLGLVRTYFDPYGPGHNATLLEPHKWTIPYQIIDRCNALIKHSVDIEMDQEKKDILIAQMRAIRGELYLDLITMFDNILLITEPFESGTKIIYEPANPTDVYTFIDADLDFAISKLDWTVESGRYGQGVARHIRGKSAMWQGKWQEAADQFDAIVENGTHHLIELDKVFFGDRNNAESLYTYQFSQADGGENSLAGGGSTFYPALFNNRYYELSSGELIQDVALGGQSFGWAFPNDYLRSLYDEDNDLRFETYYYPLQYFVNNPDLPNFGEPLPESSIEDNFRRYHWSIKKYQNDNKPRTSTESYTNYMYYRFAETLLLGAEAHWRASGSDTDIKALEYINMIRERSFGSSAYNFTSINLETYLEEYARELAFEKKRWFLLKRLGLLVERVNTYYMYGSNSTNVVNRTMENHMVRLPIPQSEINLMGDFPQNPNY